jgi:uncharacterized 2Fe-2S/4Fe-4S cluster protein (DUF4445 family)
LENLSDPLARPVLVWREGEYDGGAAVAAVDVGTTVIKAQILLRETGEPLVKVALANPQASYGADVLARLRAAREIGQGPALRRWGLDGVRRLLLSASHSSGVPLAAVERCALSGNAAMTLLLLGDDPSSLAVAPHVSPHEGAGFLPLSPKDIGLSAAAEAFFLPVLGGFVGGDVTAGILATDMDLPGGTRLFVDVGTNGEIVLARNGGLFAVSAAAGPALEGGHLSRGMHAMPGAVASAVVDAAGEWRLGVIGDVEPRGFCGSGIIELLAAMLRAGVMDASGELLKGRPGVRLEGRQVVFAPLPEYPRLVVTQEDVRAVQLAVGALSAARKVLLREQGVDEEELQEVLLAGSFGAHLDLGATEVLGLLPTGGPSGRVREDAALEGTAACAVSAETCDRAVAVANRVRHVNLAERGFEKTFLDCLAFPGGETSI